MHLLCFTALLAGLALSAAVNKESGREGCYEDNGGRVFKQWQNTHEKNTVTFCRNMCQDYKFAGMEAGNWCMCGDEIPTTALPDERCNYPCPGNPEQTCGGGWALEVYPVEPKPVLLGKPMGCFQDASDRAWKTGLIKLQSNSPQRCFNSCRGFRYAGMEAGTWCVCGDTLPLTPLPRTSCLYECSGYPGKKCGGGWALDVFELREVPAPVQVSGCDPFDYQPRGDIGIYKLFTQRKSWNEAWQQCEDDDAHLVIINSEEEAEILRNLFARVPSETRVHAGFHDLTRLGNYRTIFGESLSTTGYTEWSTVYPNVTSPVQHCGCLDVRAQLAQIDGNCAAQAVFVCEKKSDSPDANGTAVDFDIRDTFSPHDH